MSNPARPELPPGSTVRTAITASDIRDAGTTMQQMASELDCLRHQAMGWESATNQVLTDVGLQPGMRCLDVGSGIGTVLRLMADRVGLGGQVVGLDSNSRAGQFSLLDLHRQGYQQVSFLRGDVNRTNEIPPESFDLVFGRFLLFHMIDPAATLRRMYEWVKPGGCLVVQDYDLAPLDIHPHHQLFAEFRRICFAVMAPVAPPMAAASMPGRRRWPRRRNWSPPSIAPYCRWRWNWASPMTGTVCWRSVSWRFQTSAATPYCGRCFTRPGGASRL
jgi:ubiquinone/menaquinone biosynthesis C-methylase UbiE